MNQETLPDTVNPDEVADPTGEHALLSRISHMSGSEKTAEAKADYLGWRACGFPVRQALVLSDNSHATLTRWRRDDPEFTRVETEELSQLQHDVSKDLIQLDFLRNMRMAMRADAKILYKASQIYEDEETGKVVAGIDALTPREFKYLQRIRSMYSPSDLVTMTKALSAGDGEPGDFASAVFKLLEARNKNEEMTVRTMEVTVAKGHDDSDEDKSPYIEGQSQEV